MYVYIEWLFPTYFEQSINKQSWNRVKEYYIHIVPCLVLRNYHSAFPQDVGDWDFFSKFNR